MCDSGLAQAREHHLGCGRGLGKEALEKQIPRFSGVHTRGSLSEVNILGKFGTGEVRHQPHGVGGREDEQ